MLAIVSLSVRPSDAIYPTRFVDTTSTFGLVQLTSDFVHMKASLNIDAQLTLVLALEPDDAEAE